MSFWHKLFGIRVSDTDKTRFTKTKEKTVRIKKERIVKDKNSKTGNKNSSG
jgi:hypothetical protein